MPYHHDGEQPASRERATQESLFDQDKLRAATPTYEYYVTHAPGSVSSKIRPPERPYRQTAEVRGIEITVMWDNDYRRYSVYLVDPLGQYDSSLILASQRPEMANIAFVLAVSIAKTADDPSDLGQRLREQMEGLPLVIDPPAYDIPVVRR